MKTSRVRAIALLVGCLVVAFVAAGTATAAQPPGLPPGYNVLRIDSPLPIANGGFGNTNAPIGDVNGSGHEDIAAAQYTGSLNGDGILYEIDPVTGNTIRFTNAPDPSTGQVAKDGADTFLARYGDIGSCPDPITPTANNPGPVCPDPVMGPPDGVPDILWGLGGTPVKATDGTVVQSVGRVYIIDGKTMNVLKVLDMPAADITQIETIQKALPAQSGTVPVYRGGFGRTATAPRGLPACIGNAGVATCPTMPSAVAKGDITSIDPSGKGGLPSIIVGANQFPEIAGSAASGGTALPFTQCATQGTGPGVGVPPTAASQVCVGSGRSYVYSGGAIAGTSPATPANTPQMTIKNPAAQLPFPNATSAGDQNQNFGHVQYPIGDVGTCQQGGSFIPVTPGALCPLVDRSTLQDGIPDYIICAHRAYTPIWNPDPANYEEGACFLYDGATGSILQVYTDPQPQPNTLFGFTTGEQFPVGDVGESALPDVIFGSWNDSGSKTQAGVGWVFSGNVASNQPNFARIDDPTPKTMARFANPVEGVGKLVGGSAVGNQVMAGDFSNVPTTGMADTNTTVNFMVPQNNQSLQTIQDPDNQAADAFGMHVIPLGDLNGTGQLSFAVTAPRWATSASPPVLGQGRMYIFTPNPNAVVPTPPGPPEGPAGPAGSPGPGGSPGPAGSMMVAIAGRTLDIDASKSTVKSGGSVTLRGVLEAFANPTMCQASQSVLLQDRAPSGSLFKTFATVKTTASGAFKSSAVKLKGTEFFRARIEQSSICAGAQSDRLTVQVAGGKKAHHKSRRR